MPGCQSGDRATCARSWGGDDDHHHHHRVDDGVDDHVDNGDPVWDDEGVTVEIGQVVRLEATNHQC